MAYGEAHEVERDLYDLPRAGPDEADDGARDNGAPRRVEELVVAPAAVDDLGQDRDQGEGRDEVGDLVVERDGLEEVLQKSGPVQGRADQDERYDPGARHPGRLQRFAGSSTPCLYPKSLGRNTR